jgi:prepilin-type N-terminal cleavage/methylation domain-containing protein
MKSTYTNWIKGFSILETMTVIAIMGIILSVVMYSFNDAKARKELEITTDSIAYRLQEAKTSALSGKDGKNWGVHFDSNSYVYFSGNTYNPSDPNNSSTTIPINLTMSLTGGVDTVIFSRITGKPQAIGTVTVTNTNNTSITAGITVGEMGDINVVK